MRKTNLQVTKLSELLPAVVKLACEWLDLLMNNLVSTNISSLRKSLSTDIAAVRSLPSVPSFVCLTIC